MLTKLICRGSDFPAAVARARRAVAEFRVRGVTTNIAFLQAVLDEPDFRAGKLTTSFIDDRPQLVTRSLSGDRGTKLLSWLADVTVNRPHGPAPIMADPREKLPAVDLQSPPPPGSRQQLRTLGPERWPPSCAASSRWRSPTHVPRRAPVAARDQGAHHRPAARGRPRGAHHPPAVVAGGLGRGDLRRGAALPARGPVERLAALREATPNICLQMLLRGRNTGGYTPYRQR
jgi:pyruvate carboxylase